MAQATSIDVENTVIGLLDGSELSRTINGGVYHGGERPVASRKEDITVSFGAGTAGQIETGTVNVYIYVPDKDECDNATFTANTERLAEISTFAAGWAEQLCCQADGYVIELRDTVQVGNIPAIHQHFVAVRLEYKHCGIVH